MLINSFSFLIKLLTKHKNIQIDTLLVKKISLFQELTLFQVITTRTVLSQLHEKKLLNFQNNELVLCVTYKYEHCIYHIYLFVEKKGVL